MLRFHTDDDHSQGDILLVDDNAENLRILTDVLRDRGYGVRQVISGAWALEMVERLRPALILLDVQMPGMDAFEVCRIFKSRESTSTIPVIFVTAQDALISRMEGFEAGGSDYITKPFYVEEVIARVAKQLDIQKLARNLARRNRQMEQVLSALPIPYIITRPDGEIHNGNALAMDLFRVRPSDVTEINAEDFYADPEERENMVVKVLDEGLIKNREVKLKTRAGMEFWALISASAIELEKGVGIFIGLTDITLQKELERKLEQLAMTDPLTGILNRRAFASFASKERDRAIRHDHLLAVLELDIDHFKRINDTYGHDMGDKALIHFVGVVRENLRSTDVFGRMGGEEFALILAESDIQGAVASAERLRQAVETSSLTLDENRNLRLTVSCGVTLWGPDELLDLALNRADKALYQAKKEGRNRTAAVPFPLREGADNP